MRASAALAASISFHFFPFTRKHSKKNHGYILNGCMINGYNSLQEAEKTSKKKERESEKESKKKRGGKPITNRKRMMNKYGAV